MFTREQFRVLFGRFRDLNLVTLLHNLESDHVARGDWESEGQLCPLAHGLSSNQHVRQVKSTALHQVNIGVPRDLLDEFIDVWDIGDLSRCELQSNLQALWQERLDDADAVQKVLTSGHPIESCLPLSREESDKMNGTAFSTHFLGEG